MNSACIYAVAPDGVFWTLQGEGHLRGSQMAFVRLAGCSINCPGCDTNYTVGEKLPLDELLSRVERVTPSAVRDQWVWVTGGGAYRSRPPSITVRPQEERLLHRGRDQRCSTRSSHGRLAIRIPTQP